MRQIIFTNIYSFWLRKILWNHDLNLIQLSRLCGVVEIVPEAEVPIEEPKGQTGNNAENETKTENATKTNAKPDEKEIVIVATPTKPNNEPVEVNNNSVSATNFTALSEITKILQEHEKCDGIKRNLENQLRRLEEDTRLLIENYEGRLKKREKEFEDLEAYRNQLEAQNHNMAISLKEAQDELKALKEKTSEAAADTKVCENKVEENADVVSTENDVAMVKKTIEKEIEEKKQAEDAKVSASGKLSMEITEIYSHTFLTKISWKQRFWLSKEVKYLVVDFTKKILVRVNFLFFHTVR